MTYNAKFQEALFWVVTRLSNVARNQRFTGQLCLRRQGEDGSSIILPHNYTVSQPRRAWLLFHRREVLRTCNA